MLTLLCIVLMMFHLVASGQDRSDIIIQSIEESGPISSPVIYNYSDFLQGPFELQQLPHTFRYFDTIHISNPDPARVAILSGVTAVTGFAINEGMKNAWWSGQRGPFHFAEDRRYARDLDKLGHVYGGFAASNIAYRLINWTGYSETRSAWYGATVGLLFQLYVEIQDGFATDWGFERWDMVGNFIGSAYFLARYHIPMLQYTTLKFSYYPSPRHGEPKGEEGVWSDVAQTWVDDYEGHTYWLSFKAGNAAVEYLDAPRWLRFINIAAGWSLSDFRREWEWYLALDWNLQALPGNNWYLQRLWEWLDMIKLPAPAVRLAPGGTVWYGIYL